MKIKSVLPFVAGLIIFQSCSTLKNEVMWVGGIQTECGEDSEKTTCLNVIKGEKLNEEKWEKMSENIDGFSFEEGIMKKIEVKKSNEKSNPIKTYSLVKEIESKEDIRFQLHGNWILASINGGNISKMIVLPSMKIDLKSMMISGNGGCNLYSARIEKLTSQNIKLTENLGTLMECANKNIEDEYLKTLSGVDKYKVNDGELIFTDKEGKNILTFIKIVPSKGNPALEGTWINTRINGDVIDQDENNPSITFDLEQLIVAGKDGCNNFNAKIENLSKSDLLIGEIAATKMMCPEMEIPTKFLNAVNQTVAYKIIDSELVLLDKRGNKVLVFSKQ